MTVENKLALITGAAGGIGRATAELFAARGAQVIALDRDAALLQELAQTGITTIIGDMTDPVLPETIAAEITRIGKPLAILVNNAGIGGGGRLDQTSDDELRRYMEVNVIGLFRLARFAVGQMRAAGAGSIVNVASIYAEVGAQNSSGYSASKGAVAALTRQMATGLRPRRNPGQCGGAGIDRNASHRRAYPHRGLAPRNLRRAIADAPRWSSAGCGAGHCVSSQ